MKDSVSIPVIGNGDIELVYTGVQYAYTSALYSVTEDTEVGEPDADAIIGKFSVENATATKDGDNIKITTNDKVYCLATISGTEMVEKKWVLK